MHIVEVAVLQAVSAFAHEVGLKGLRIISGINFCKQKLFTRNCGMVLTSTMTIMVAAQVHLVKLINLLDDGFKRSLLEYEQFFVVDEEEKESKK